MVVGWIDKGRTSTRYIQANIIGGRRVRGSGSLSFLFFLSFLSLDLELFFFESLEEFTGTSVVVDGPAV